MERLTEYLGGIPHIKRTINGINGKANYLRDFDIEAVRKLAYYEDLAEQGRLVVLPCKVGDMVYQKDHCGEIYEAVVQSIVIDRTRTIFITSGIGFDETAVGKTIFLSRAEAEKALKGVSEDA